jgi:hypothetical protein
MPNTYKDDDAKPFLEKARDRFRYCIEAWKDIREQHDLDMRFLAGESWDETEARRRKDKNLPMIHLDELTQYINQLVNDVRQNKRAVQVLPKGAGANDKTAALRSDWIRGVEYISQAQTAYTTGFEGMTGGSYGFCKLETYYESEKSFNLSARIVPITNANTVVFDPDCKQYDCSDAEDCWEIDFISQDTFRRRFPDAEIKTFTDEIQKVDPYWIKPKQVQLASWWKVVIEKIELHLVDLGDSGQPVVMRSDELPKDFDRKRILKSRDYDDRRIVQYILNGVEVLETNDPRKGKGWPGNWIPIIPFWGKELFVDEGSGSKRMLFSLIRLARDPQRLLNYYASQELMEAKMTPRTPYMGPRGMMSGNPEEWQDVNDTPKAFIEFDLPEGYPPGSTKPERTPFIPNFQAYEMAKESASRAIMKAMGISPLPTAAQRGNEKSGVALSRIQGERSQGSFHFIDNLDRSLVYCGKQLDDLFDKIHDTPRDIPIRKEDGTHSMARIGDRNDPKNKEFAGDHDVTITTGPSFESQREEVQDFADTLAANQQVFPLIGDLVVKLRNLGPIGDQIAERLTPPQFANTQGDDVPATAKAAIAHLTQQAQQMQQIITQLQQEKAAKMVEKDAAFRIAALQENTKLVVAQATLAHDQAESILQAELQKIQTILGQAHDQATQATDQQHEMNMANQEHQQNLVQASHEASLAPQIPPSANGGSNGTGGTQ